MRNHRTALLATTAVVLAAAPAMAAGDFNKLTPAGKLSLLVLLLVLVACLCVGVLGTVLLFTVLRPQAVRETTTKLRDRPVHCLVVGALTLGVLFAFAALLENVPSGIGGLLGIALALCLSYLTVSGLAAVANELGERLQTGLCLRGTGATAGAVLHGTLLFAALSFLPILGWLVQVTILVVGVGASARLLIERVRRRGTGAAPAVAADPTQPEPAAPGTPSTEAVTPSPAEPDGSGRD